MKEYQRQILAHWYAYIYEQQEDGSEIVACVKNLLGDKPLRVLEPACGGAKLCGPLAEAGHDVTGFDLDDAMLRYAHARALPNLRIYQADMLTSDWGSGFEVVLLGANLMININTDWDYKQAQKKLLQRAHSALRAGGHLFIDFDCPDSLEPYAASGEEWVCFEGEDDCGTYGRYIVMDGTADQHTRMVRGARRYEITPKDGEPFTIVAESVKHFPTLEHMCAMLYRAGFTIERLYGGHNGEPFDDEHRRCVLWCRKID